jgi:hypothetical protein
MNRYPAEIVNEAICGSGAITSFETFRICAQQSLYGLIPDRAL